MMLLQQQVFVSEDTGDLTETRQQHHTPSQRLSRSDVHFPLTTPRKRAPSIPLLMHAATEDGQGGVVRLRGCESSSDLEAPSSLAQDLNPAGSSKLAQPSRGANIQDLPEELRKRILDYIFGDMQPVNAASTSTGLSHRMRHPRRKAVSELALISTDMRTMVQERIYRHIKIKGTKTGLSDSKAWFQEHAHLAPYVRHIEYWVPVWGDKAAALSQVHAQQYAIAHELGENILPGHEFPGLQFKLSTYSATLSQIFEHLAYLFPSASIFTLEGGHCKNSNMIKHFPSNLFTAHMDQQLSQLPGIRVFAMRGAWNIMRGYNDWRNIERALPNLKEWHCGYAKPRLEAYDTVNDILSQLPSSLRHVDISLDSMFSKDDTVLGSNTVGRRFHMCEQLGRIAPYLDSLTYTGKICECFWTSAKQTVERNKALANKLKSLEIVVKSCCRQRVKNVDPVTGEDVVEELGGIMADGAGIGNLVFIGAFERLVLGALDLMAAIHSINRVKVRYIDLDSPCQQLNPYWNFEKGQVNGVWNEKILEKMSEVRPTIHYERLEDGLGGEDSVGATKKEDDVFDWSRSTNLGGVGSTGGVSSLYPRTIPKSINTNSYKILAEARSS